MYKIVQLKRVLDSCLLIHVDTSRFYNFSEETCTEEFRGKINLCLRDMEEKCDNMSRSHSSYN